MSVTTTIPITVTPEATARIAELGMQREFEEMLDYAKEIVPFLRSIRVTLEYDPEGELGPQVVIWSMRDDTDWEQDTSDWDTIRWKSHRFPPQVCVQFVMITLYEAAHGG